MSDSESTRIVVGVDGSPPSHDALRWALEEAHLRHQSVEVVHAWTYPVMTCVPAVLPPPSFAREDLEADARQVLEATVDAVIGNVGTDVPVRRILVEGSAAEQLVERSRTAEMLVLGQRGHGGFTGLLLGSVSEQCAAHALCPTVIVRSVYREINIPFSEPRQRVVVGIDGSEPARRALRWAAEEAQRRHADLEVVHAWHPPLQPIGLVLHGANRNSAESCAKAVLKAAKEVVGDRAVRVEYMPVDGPPAGTLVDVSTGATLLVVGSRGRGGFAGLLLGSVSAQVLHHGRCPLVIVH